MAAPVAKDQELELHVDSLAYGGNGVARLNGFVVFVRRGLPGRHGPGARDEGEAQPRRGARGRGDRGRRRARRRAVRTLPRLRRLPLPGSRVRGAGRGEGGPGRRRARGGSAASAEPPLEPIVPAESVFHYRNKLEYSFTQHAGRARARVPPGRPLGRGARGRPCWLTTDLGNGIRDAVRAWAREERLEAYDQADADRLSPSPRRARGTQHRPGPRAARDRAGRAFRGRLPRRGAAPLPGGAIDPLGRERHARGGHEPALHPALGRGRDRGAAVRPAVPRAAERLPADEHGHGGTPVRARGGGSGADRERDRLRPLLRHRHDRARPRGTGADGLGGRGLARSRSPARSRTPT